MLAPSFSALNASLIADVCASGWPESSSLEFKRDAPGNSDKDKHELLKDTNYELGIDSFRMFRNSPKADRDHLIAPELWIDNLETADIDDTVRPLLDTLWQGFGVERCLDFEPNTGTFKPRQG